MGGGEIDGGKTKNKKQRGRKKGKKKGLKYKRHRKCQEPFKAQCYPWQIPKGHSYLPTGVCFVDLNRVTFAVGRNASEEKFYIAWR